jgi:hypothetical protein
MFVVICGNFLFIDKNNLSKRMWFCEKFESKVLILLKYTWIARALIEKNIEI